MGLHIFWFDLLIMNRNLYLSLTRFWRLVFPFYILPRACTAHWIGWVTHQPRSLLISLTDLDLDQRPPRYGCPTICIQDSIKAPPRPFEPARIPGPASSDLNYATRSSRWRICLCLCIYFVFFLCHCLCLYLRTLPVKSQACSWALHEAKKIGYFWFYQHH